MEIHPFKITINFIQYLESHNIDTKDIKSGVNIYRNLIYPIKIEYLKNDYYIIGYHSNTINNDCICVLSPITTTSGHYEIKFISASIICINVEVVLKAELKDIKTVEQLKMFSDEQSKD